MKKQNIVITKEDVSRLLDGKSLLHEHAKNLQEKYFPCIRKSLDELPDDINLGGLSVWDELHDDTSYGESLQGRFSRFLTNSTDEEIEKWLHELNASLNIKQYCKNQMSEKLKRGRSKRIKRVIALTIILAIMAIATGIVAWLVAHDVVPDIANDIANYVDIILGIIFFIYELWSDVAESKTEKKATEYIESGDYSKAIKIINIDKIVVSGHGRFIIQ